MTTWTKFWDMHSGGGTKEPPYDKIYIEAPEEEAKVIFYNRFGHNPERVTCTCCGEDYSIEEGESLSEMTGFHRSAAPVYFYKDTGEEATDGGLGDRTVKYDKTDKCWKHKGKPVEFGYAERPDLSHMEYGVTKQSCIDKYMSLDDYLESEDVLVIKSEDIKDEERVGSVPESGYVWVD